MSDPTAKQLVCGYSITASKARITSVSSLFCVSNEPATVRLHKLGSEESAWLTPEEARRLAEALVQAADVADTKEPK